MKHFNKIIALFIIIFITGILVTLMNINTPLNTTTPSETVEAKKDSLQLNNKTV